MASLVLSAAGAAVGGSLGGAVGSLLGRQLDRSFGRLPQSRISDLRVPSSQYGDAIPAILKRMRVAGVVLWAAKPVGSITVSKSATSEGASVSFAYALSSSRVDYVARMWADGRLIRDADGRQDVAFSFRLHSGDQDQESDPLIASILGDDQAPAFRGIAYIVFENFDLSTFGNRLPLITVEVGQSVELLTAEKLLSDTLGIDLLDDRQHELEGFALSGDSISDALEPLCRAFSPAFSYGSTGWRLARSSLQHIIDDTLWNLDLQPPLLSQVGDGGDLPTRVSVRFFDPSSDFAAGEKSARFPGAERMRRIELPAAMLGDNAKAVAFEQLAGASLNLRRSWLRLPLSYSHLNVGDQISREARPKELFVICDKVLKSGELWLRLKLQSTTLAPLITVGGTERAVTELHRETLAISLIELQGDFFESDPQVGILVSGGHQPFRQLPLIISLSGAEHADLSAGSPSPRGRLSIALPAAPSDVLDMRSILEVEFEQDPLLTSCDDEALLAGANLLWVNGEYLQFAIAEPLGGARYKLSRLLRGRWASDVPDLHEKSAPVLVVAPSNMTKIHLPRERIGSTLSVSVHGPDNAVATANLMIAGVAAKPWAPSHIVATETQDAVQLSWVRRCKEGTPWLDGVDAPLGSSREAYLVRLFDQAGRLVELQSSGSSATITTQMLDALGPRPWRAEIRQLGDFAAGRPGTLIIN